MGSHVRAPRGLAAGLAFMASLLAAPAALAQGMDPTPERLVLPPTGVPASPYPCAQLAAASPSANILCRPDNLAFKNLVSELGFALAPSTMHPARTIGFGGFVLSFEAAYTHINANDTTHSAPANGSTPAYTGIQYWHLGTQGSTDANGNYSTQNNSPDSLLGVYSLMVRKGLPFGFELAGALGYMQNSSLWTLGADLRWALLEGFRTGILGYLPDVAVGTGVRTMTGSSKMYLTTIGIDVELSKPFTLSDTGIVTPYVGFQHLIIYGNSAVLDSTPNVNALQQCGYQGRNPVTGAPQCSNNVPGTSTPNDNDFNNNITFNPVQLNRERAFLGVTYRYEILYLGAQFLFDVVPPNAIDSDLDSNIQWTMSLQAGVFF
jgi:hypothetical protein